MDMGMDERVRFGARVRELRKSRGLSIAQLAGSGMSTSYLSRVETGARPPTDRVVDHLCEVLRIERDELFADRWTVAEQLAVAVSAGDPGLRARALREVLAGPAEPAERFHALWQLAEHEDTTDLLAGAVRAADDSGVEHLRARAHAALARHLRVLGQIHPAREHATTALRVLDAHPDLPAPDAATVLMAHLSVAAEAGEAPRPAVRERALHLERLAGELPPVLRAQARWTLAALHAYAGDHTGASTSLALALEAADLREDLVLWVRLRLAGARLHLMATPPATAQARQLLAEVRPFLPAVPARHEHEHTALDAHLAAADGHWDRAGHSAAATGASRLAPPDRLRLRALAAGTRLAGGDRTAAADLRHLADTASDSGARHTADEVLHLALTALAGPAAQHTRP
ncbi:helix-turn-helix domain-containing protein [Kitasatospora sp. NPDC088134]|uniref:helix-turn-helix domain-containing protein n=1 Tax=Kitasatospora sp. NPDC088134 TaxID=3364071 RepID=UPI0037F2B95F